MSSSDPAEIIAVAQGEAERRMSDLSVPGGANSHGKGRLSARGNWHTRLRIGIMGGTTATWSRRPKSHGCTTLMK